MFGTNRSKAAGLKIIIIGCGKIGITLIERLSEEGHDITVIDRNPDKVKEITDKYDVMGISGNGATHQIQEEAGVSEADVLVAVTDSDELNLLCCIIARRTSECEAIARVRKPDYSEEAEYLKEKLGLARIINPELESANVISRILYLPTALSIMPFAKGKAEMVRIRLPEGNVLTGKRLMELGNTVPDKVLICAVERDGDVHIPGGSFVLKPGDIISYIAPLREGKQFIKQIGLPVKHVRDTLIVGGGRSGYYLAKQLLEHGHSVTVIESNRKRCEQLAVDLPKAIVIHGDGSNDEILREAGLDTTQALVALTGIDEENILLSVYAREVSDAKVVTKINRMNFNNTIKKLDIESVVYPRYLVSEAIIGFVRSKSAARNSNIEAMIHLLNDRAEAIEFVIGEGSDVIGKPLYELKIKKNVIIACINRKGDIIIPRGRDEIKAGDSVIIVTTHRGFNDISDILADK